MTALLRILIIIPFAYISACIAAGLVFAASLQNVIDGSDPAAQGFAVVFGLIVAAHAGALAAVPVLIAAVLAEALRWRSFFFWAPFGGALGLGAKAFVDGPDTEQTPQMIALYAAAGLVAGAVYWFLAGRNSGAMLQREHPARREDGQISVPEVAGIGKDHR